ncbi:MAG TPA: aminoacyl-tRNA hydrolase [Candidatus Acidoferrales bacterium]|nr:aminoacyl-tRNA hydrolase [Candidatus Acidoferrales bacterium]
MKIVLGLGNPGKRYERTRHNLGFLVLDEVGRQHGVRFVAEPSLQALVGQWRLEREEVALVKPQTYMNRSGVATRSVLQRYDAAVQDLVVVHDDLDLPFGRLRIRTRGSAGGHRGVQSILDALGEETFLRVRIGIGRPTEGSDATEYVLERFSEQEWEALRPVIRRAAEAVACLIQEGAKAAMDKFNRAAAD